MKQIESWFLYVLFFSVFTLSSAFCFGQLNKVEWMKTIQDTLLISKLSIPGTHDSGAKIGGPSLQTQDIGVLEQLQSGIRAFDIRLQKKDDKLGVFHSHAFQNIYWEEDVLSTFISFLDKYPSETLIVSLKKEGGKLEDYSSLLSVSLRDSAYQRYFLTDFHPDLSLSDCRGKILFLHRDSVMENYPGAVCIGWQDNTSCLLTLCSSSGIKGSALLQDEYQYESDKEADKKIKACIRNFDRICAGTASSNLWGISFMSATGLPLGTPIAFAGKVNGSVVNYLRGKNKRNCGIVFIDFIDRQEGLGLVEYLIGSNF